MNSLRVTVQARGSSGRNLVTFIYSVGNQNVPLWQRCYFELKILETQQMQEGLQPPFYVKARYKISCEKGAPPCTRKGKITFSFLFFWLHWVGLHGLTWAFLAVAVQNNSYWNSPYHPLNFPHIFTFPHLATSKSLNPFSFNLSCLHKFIILSEAPGCKHHFELPITEHLLC